MSNAKQMAAMDKEDYNGKVKRNSRKKKKSFMEYAIWVDFPVNAGILTYVVVRSIQALLEGYVVALTKLENGIAITGNPFFDQMLMPYLPGMIAYIALAVVVEIIYLILRLWGKQPFITEKYAIIILIGKVLWVIYFAAAALFF